eukprot:TRINITY_DN28896_c0_g1_i2.p1 TRINITY_DN28896_c0_g1~~TRINITY_DN28896_c0_g1_i2.p1  ORF type:complete len:529 (+),score=84.75 TRINITY_DN28896_c0_g1_i2:42-1628(+)
MAMFGAMDDRTLFAKGSDGVLMQDFIRNHMTSILHPVSQHVRDLQADFQVMSKDMASWNANQQHHRQLVDDQDSQIRVLNARVDELLRRVDMVTASCAKMSEWPNARGVEFDPLSVHKAYAPPWDYTNAIKDLKKRLDTMEHNIQEQQISLSVAGSTSTEQAAGLTQLFESNDVLKCRLDELAKQFETVEKSNSETERSLKKIAGNAEKQRDSDSKQLARLGDRAACLDEIVSDCSRKTKRLDDRIKTVEDGIERVVASLEREFVANSRFETVQRRQQELTSTLKDHGKSLQEFDERMSDLKKEMASDKKACSIQSRDIQSKVDGNSSAVSELQESQHNQFVEITRLDRVANDLMRGQRDLQKLNEGSTKETKGLAQVQKEQAGKLELQAFELGRAQDELRDNGNCLDDSMRQVQCVKDDLAATVVNVSNLNACYDYCTRNLHGLNRGLQNAYHHSFNGENSLLSPQYTQVVADRQLVPLRPTTPQANRPLQRPSTAMGRRAKTPLRSDFVVPTPLLPPHACSDTGCR